MDEDVHVAGAARERFHVCALHQVGRQRFGVAQLGRELPERLPAAPAQQQVRAALVQCGRDRAAQAARGTRQQDT